MIDTWTSEEVIIMNNSLNEKYQRLKAFIHRKREKDISIYMVILFHLPRRLLSKPYSIYGVLINELFMKNFQSKY